MTETGKILKELKNLRKIENNNIKLVLMYAEEHKLTLKEVGLYKFSDGRLIVDCYPSDEAKALFNEIITCKAQ
jgi:hypothetical protein